MNITWFPRLLLAGALAIVGHVGLRAQSSVLLTSGSPYNSGSSLGLVGGASLPLYFRIVVPGGQTRLVVETSGGTGGLDLFVRRGDVPSASLYDRASFGFSTSTQRTVTIENPAAATYYILLGGYGFYGVSVRATYSGAGGLPTWVWAKSTESGAGGSDLVRESFGSAIDSGGNTYVAGVFENTLQFGPVQLTAGAVSSFFSSEGGFLAKYTPAGQVAWAVKDVGQRANAVAVSAAGGVYVTGAFTGTVRFTSAVALTTNRASETFVARYNATNGALVWARAYPGAGNSEGFALAVHPATGEVVVGGYETRAVARVPGGAQVARWFKVDANGNKLADTTIAGDDFSFIAGIAVDAAGNIGLGGAFKSSLPLPGAAALVSGRTSNDVPTADAFFAKVAPNGATLWARAVGGTGTDDYGDAIAMDPSGNLFGSGALGAGHFLVRFDAAGTQSWRLNSSSGGGNYMSSVVSDGRGGALWAGTFSGTFSTGSASFQSGSQAAGYLLSVNQAGAVQWGQQSSARTTTVAAGANGEIGLSGYYYSNASLGGIALSASGREIFTARLQVAVPPSVVVAPVSQTVAAGQSATLTVETNGPGALSYQWRRNGVPIAGATGAALVLGNVSAASAGSYDVVVSNAAGSITSAAATLTVAAASEVGRLANLSIRSAVGAGDSTLIVGFTVGGVGTAGPKPLLARGVGPSLATFGVANAHPNPALAMMSGPTIVAANDNWAGSPQIAATSAQMGAFALAGNDSKDAAIFQPALAAGAYTVQITGGAGSGLVLVELYDATPAAAFTAATPRLVNVSARTQVGTGANILIAGFAVGGRTARTVLVRAIGPSLAQFGVTGALADPRLALFDAGQSQMAGNDDWGGGATLSSAFGQVGAFALAPGSKDAALLVTVAPGTYTVQVSGVAGGTGVALVEVYEVP